MNTKLESNVEKILIGLYAFILFYGILSLSMANQSGFFYFINHFKNVAFLLLLLFSIHKRNFPIFNYILGIAFIIFAFINYKINGDHSFIYIAIIMFSMANVNPHKIAKYSFLTILITISSIIFLSLIHVIPNLVYLREGVSRQSLGTIYPLTLSAIIFQLSILSCFIFNQYNKLKFLILIIVTFLVYKVTGSRNDSVIILFMAFINLFGEKVNQIKFFKSKGLGLLMIFASILLSFITKFLNYGTESYFIWDKLLSNRLRLQDYLINNFKIPFFGQYILQNGNGGWQGLQNTFRYYFFIDNAYLKLLYVGGIALFALFITIILYRIFSLIKINNLVFVLIIYIFLINGIVEDSLVSPFLDVIIPFMLTPSYMLKMKKG